MKRLLLIFSMIISTAYAQNAGNILSTRNYIYSERPTYIPMLQGSTINIYKTHVDSITWNSVKYSDTSVFARKIGLFTKTQADALYKPLSYVPTWSELSGKPTLFSGNYNDLTNKPTIPAAQVQTDWNATSGLGVLLNKPTIKRIENYRGTSSTIGGNVGRYSVTYATPFSTVPNVLVSIQAGSDYMQQYRIVSSTTSGFVVETGIRTGLTVLTVTVLSSAVTPTNGIGIDVVVVGN